MKRTLLQAFLFSSVICIVYFVIQIAIGMYNTITYVPDIEKQYENVEYLAQEVSIGATGGIVGTIVPIAIVLAVSMISFVAGKFVWNKVRRNT
ncbi:hypothetical protein [Paenibacillus agilis]|uniref:DUF4064 domain-containing protein n=1 Tax=Paenibacillus agilis TaxID=3020863 RepID=A0A559J2J9_9BACL|nr:hypothetical protein [Paenibacillus agilis]TVX94093.1 hypothetical protein FPZ44_14135 [Paenibacillus agilis]